VLSIRRVTQGAPGTKKEKTMKGTPEHGKKDKLREKGGRMNEKKKRKVKRMRKWK
jgi:hypothetical protein